MSINLNHQNYFQMAEMYDSLASFYKYVDPNKYIAYYQRHLQYMNMATRVLQEYEVQEQQRFAALQPKVRFVHASFNASNIDVYINGVRVLKDFAYKDVSNYLSLPAGKYQVDIYPAGNMVSTVLSRKIIVEQRKVYSFFISGDVKNVKWLALEEDYRVPRNETKVRFLHLSHDAPPIDIAVKNRDVLFSNLAYKKQTDYLILSPMTVDLEARLAGTSEIALSIPQVQLKPNKVYSILIVGSVANEPSLEAVII